MRGLDHRAHQVRCGQADKSNQAGLRHCRARGQRQHGNQRGPHLRQTQPQALRSGLAQGQAVEHMAHHPGGRHTSDKDRRHHRASRPADKTRAAQHEGLHGLHDVRVQQQHERAQRAQHHAHNHARQQQAQGVLHALGQQQGQQHGQHSPDESGPGKTDAHQPMGGQWRHTKRHHGSGYTERGAGGTAQQVGVCQGVAKQALGHRTGQPQQGPRQPGAQRAWQANFSHDQHGLRVVLHVQHTLKTGAAHAHAQQQEHCTGQQQHQSHDKGFAVLIGEGRGHRVLSSRHWAMMRAASAMRGPGRTTTSASSMPNTQMRCSRTALMLVQPG